MSGEDHSYFSDYDVGFIEKIWTKLLFSWINRCVAPNQDIDSLNAETLLEIVKRYKDDVYGGMDSLLSSEDVEAFIGNTYSGLQIRHLGNTDLNKKWYIMASVLLYYCCTQSVTGVVDQDICKKLEKDKQEMILKFCEQLPHDMVTIQNVEGCIKEACKPLYEVLREKEKITKRSTENKPYLETWSKHSFEDLSSFTSESTKSNIYKPNTICDSESLDYTKSFDISDQFQGSTISEITRDLEKVPFSQTGYSVSCQSSKVVESTSQRPKAELLNLLPKKIVSGGVFQDPGVISTTNVTTSALEFKPELKTIEPSIFRLDSTLVSSSKKTVERSNVVNKSERSKNQVKETDMQCESLKKHKLSKVTLPSTPNVKKIQPLPFGLPEQYSKPVNIERSQIPPVNSSQIHQKPKTIHPTGRYVKAGKESFIYLSEKRDNINTSHQSVLKKPKYNPESPPVYSKPRLQPSQAISSINIASLPGIAPSVGTDPSPSAKASLEAADAAKLLADNFSSRHDDQDKEQTKMTEKRVRLVEPEGLKKKKFVSECRGCHATKAYEPPMKTKIRNVFQFANLKGSKSPTPSHTLKKESEGAKDKEPVDETSVTEYERKTGEETVDEVPEASSSIIRRPPNSKIVKIILDNQVLCTTCCLAIMMLCFMVLVMIKFNIQSPNRRAISDPPSVGRLARSEDHGDKVYNENISLPVPDSHFAWTCRNNVCVKLTKAGIKHRRDDFLSLSRCTLLCMGPQLWPQPIGEMEFSYDVIAVTTEKLEYKFSTVPSDAVGQYVSKAFKLFLLDLARLERRERKRGRATPDLPLTKLVISLSVHTDPDPSLRLDTDETYTIKLKTKNNTDTFVHINAESFCGLRNGLETLSQLMIRDEKTGFLITYSTSSVKDGPSYRYRGLMLDTARNYIPVADIVRTVDAMAMCKLNSLHWRISDASSFPLFLESVSRMVEYGAYGSHMVYRRKDVEDIVDRAKVRGIRVVIEVAVPGPVGRPWSWTSNTHCPREPANSSCNILCLRLKMGTDTFDVLENIYREIISLTNVKDVFHLSNGLFSLANCPNLLEDREGFLEKALHRLKIANRGFVPKLPIVWLTPQLLNKYDAESWAKYGVQLYDLSDIQTGKSLAKFRLVHSAKWDLSCQMKKMRCHKFRTWQAMYKWNSWRTLDVFALEGGEAILWTDLVSPSGLDDVIWPRAAAVAERLWSDMALDAHDHAMVYFRLDTHRWRMLLRGATAINNTSEMERLRPAMRHALSPPARTPRYYTPHHARPKYK